MRTRKKNDHAHGERDGAPMRSQRTHGTKKKRGYHKEEKRIGRDVTCLPQASVLPLGIACMPARGIVGSECIEGDEVPNDAPWWYSGECEVASQPSSLNTLR